MRRVITGVNALGRSAALADGPPPVAFHSGVSASGPERTPGPWMERSVAPHEAVVHQLWAIGTDPARAGADPTLVMTAPDFETPAGETSWIVTEMGPNLDVAMHHTATIDYGFVVRGSVELGLEAGPVQLTAGDAVLVDGVRHSWRAGPEGCVIATVQVGLRPADR